MKPNFDIFMHPIIEELKELEFGVNIEMNGTSRNIKFFTISAVFDKPARAAILNTINSTGFNSCLKCQQEGESIVTANGILFNFIYS